MEKKYFDVIIVGSGLSGLSVAQFLRLKRAGLAVVLLEKENRVGGAVQSLQQDGYRAEWGPHGFLDNCPEGQELIKSAGLENRVQKAPLGQFARYFCKNGRLLELPQHPKKFITSPVLSPLAKLRILGDIWVRPKPEEQTIGQWAAHRFGKGVLPLVDAAVTGSYSGDYERLSIDAVMPGARQLEKEHGSLLRGLRHKRRTSPKKTTSLPSMQNFPDGMEELITQLAQGHDIRLGCPVEQVTKAEQGWVVQADGEEFIGRHLVVALPVNPALELLTPLSRPPVSEIPVARIVNIAMGFPGVTIPKAFGYLAPERENRFCLGAMFSSAMFPDRVPDETALLEVLVGGRRHPERLELDDDEMARRAYDDLKTLLPLPEPPRFVRVLRPASGIPQLEIGHPTLIAWRDALQKQHPDLSITGFGWDGIGMNEMIKHGHRVAQAIGDDSRGEQDAAEVRPVYF